MKPKWEPKAPEGRTFCRNCGWRLSERAGEGKDVRNLDFCAECVRLSVPFGGPQAPPKRPSKRQRDKEASLRLYGMGWIPDAEGNFAPRPGAA